MAGLLAARALSDHFEHVTLLERDPMPDTAIARKGQPQARHLHAILATGYGRMARLFPDLAEALDEGGAVTMDAAAHMHWHAYGGYRVPLEAGFDVVTMSRPFLEQLVRRRVLTLPNVTAIEDCSADGLLLADDGTSAVRGLQVSRRDRGVQETLPADLVVDATGRGSRTPRWLDALGFPSPDEERVEVGVGYATRIYERDPNEADTKRWSLITPTPPHEKRGGGAVSIEGDRRLVGLYGMAGDHPPADEDGFRAFARSLPVRDVHDLIESARPVTNIVSHKFPASLRRRYERVGRFPGGFVVAGDALASFNPVYAQGMTSAALQVEALTALLSRGVPLDRLSRPYFRAAASVVDRLWRLAVGEDFRYPETVGRKRPGTDLLNAYVLRVHRATHHDPVVCRAFLRVMHVIEPPSSLLRPDIVARVVRPHRPTAAVTHDVPVRGR